MDDLQKQTIQRLLDRVGKPPARRLEVRGGDGSDRGFVRLFLPGEETLLAILPSPVRPRGLAEARAAALIGRHLLARRIPVAFIHAYDRESGVLLCEDLGELLLQEVVGRRGSGDSGVRALYRQALQALLDLQVKGAAGFEPGWCWETPRYDRSLMLERESGYFLKACCREFLGLSELPAGLEQEFLSLAERAAAAPSGYLLHRDFQSRNLMVRGESVYIIDYQGARLGPLAYDLASLLMDPYAALDSGLQEEVLADYLDLLVRVLPYDPDQFRAEYYYLYLQRNLQIAGAYAFLTLQRHKEFFRAFLKPALLSLAAHLARERGRDFPALRELAAQCLQRLPAA